MIDEKVYEQFRDIGRDLFVADMISSHGGNMSVRYGDRLIIKRRGAMLGRLQPHDLVETRLDKNDSGVALASSELIVHRAIYQQTPALAIVHCHPRTAIAVSVRMPRRICNSRSSGMARWYSRRRRRMILTETRSPKNPISSRVSSRCAK